MTEADFVVLLTTDMFNVSNDRVADILAMYADRGGNASTDWYWAAAAVYGDYAIACPSLRAARQISKMSQKETALEGNRRLRYNDGVTFVCWAHHKLKSKK